MIKAIIFDFDEMLYFTDCLFSKWAIEKYNLSEEDVLEFFNNEFKLCRIGKLDIKEVLERYLERFRWNGTVEEFMKCWYEYGNFDDRMIDLIKILKKKGVICILVTNNEKYRINYYIENYGLRNLFDKILLSSDLGYLKPDKEMLEEILKVTKLDKNEILFCDDKASFIGEAREFGFETHLFESFTDFKSFLVEKDIL